MSSRARQAVKKRPDEFSLIERYFAPMAGEGAFGLRDDAALIEPTVGKSLVITQDAIAGGIHFFPDDPPELVARKALRVNLSDLAAKGARAKCFSLALGLSDRWDEAWIADFTRGLKEDCMEFGVSLTGGDTFATGGGFIISITAIGEIPHEQYVSRLGASSGDALYATGTIGDAAIGLLVKQGKLSGLDAHSSSFFEGRYLLPKPRCEIANTICEFGSAAIDVSDGFVADLEKLCSASEVSVTIQGLDIPHSAELVQLVQSESKFQTLALTGGDDYEILIAVPAESVSGFESAVTELDVKITRLGTFKDAGTGVTVMDGDGKQMRFSQSGYTHFGEGR